MSEGTKSRIGKRRSAARNDSTASYQARREEIASAAIRVFNRLGLQRASITSVAEEMNVDRASIYYYFSSKEELFDEVVRTVVERNFEMIKRIKESSLSPSRKLRDLIVMLMSSYGEHYPLFYIFIREDLSQVSHQRSEWSREMREMSRLSAEAVIAIIEQGYADGSFRKVGPAKVVAYGVFGIVGWTHRWFRPDASELSAEEVGKTYAELFLAGIESPYRS